MKPQTAAGSYNKASIDRAFASKFARNMFFSVLILFLLSLIGTRMFTHIDLNLYGYMVGTIVFLGGLFYRFLAWSERPPAKVFIAKGWKLLFQGKASKTAVNSADNLVLYRFIWNRAPYRWLQHFLIGWGCMLSCFVTFPLVFGWMYFTMDDNGMYNVVGMGMNLMTVRADGFIAYLFYNALNITAFMVIAGVCMALYRRVKNMQARAEQTFMYDFMPLYMLLFVSVTGLLLTFSNLVMHGFLHPELSLIHQFSVIVTLIYLPFGKLAHIPMRPLGVFVKNYREHYSAQAMKPCQACGTEFISLEQSNDVIEVLKQNEINFKTQEGYHLAELCPSCRRKFRIGRFSGIPTHTIKAKEANQDAKG
ncbi:respiratory nitrate reductase subunit gamma [Paenibacillus turpanensis]|uniref:respiratory nitrate reductase subunit gamma n=1 Tax=Paenibacillus turpanensis TaxID=2689078 RepID=UPI001408E73C|nr:respiratory nitrate reductase subunit gamma [Paenibacillus turpanensis]